MSTRPRSLALILLCGLLVAVTAPAGPTRHALTGSTRPDPGLAVRCRVLSVYDGDTMTVEWTHQARVRVMDLWCAEVRTTDDEAKARGLAARDWARDRFEGQEMILQVPFEGARTMGDLTTMGRVLGQLWPLDDDPRSVAQRVRDAGHGLSDAEHAQRSKDEE